jgi:PTS system mannose-specific IIA component
MPAWRKLASGIAVLAGLTFLFLFLTAARIHALRLQSHGNSVAIMIGIFLITHGSLGESLVQCACHVLNKRPPQIAQLGVSGQDDPLDALPLAREMMKLVDTGEGVLLLTDIFGATPSNIALKLIAWAGRGRGRGEPADAAARPDLSRKGHGDAGRQAVAGGRDGVMLMKGARDAQG